MDYNKNRPIALTGSKLDNGDAVTGSEHSGMTVIQYAEKPPIPGRLESVSHVAALRNVS